MTKAQREIKLKLGALNHAKTSRSVAVTCRRFGISRSSFYLWKFQYERLGEAGLINKKPIPKTYPNGIAHEIQQKVIYLRKKYHLGPDRIHMYLQKVSPGHKSVTQ